MNVQKVNKYFNRTLVISSIYIFIFIVFIVILFINSFLRGKYITVNNRNRSEIIELLEENDDIINYSDNVIRDDISEIGIINNLRDWALNIKYTNGEIKTIILEKNELTNLNDYIISNNILYNEIIFKVLIVFFIISIIFIPVYITFKICYVINIITDKKIEKEKRLSEEKMEEIKR